MKAIIQPRRLQVLVLLCALFAAMTGYADIDVWTGAFNGTWDTTTTNWSSHALSVPVTFSNGVPVQFDDTATGPTTINLATNVFPAGVTFSNNSLTYIITGGTISGAGGLTLLGSGPVTLAGTNNYTGPTTIGTGSLTLVNSNALGSASSIIIADGGLLDVSGVGPTATYTLGASASLIASGNVQGAFINGSLNGTVSLGSRPVILNNFGGNPSIQLLQGNLSLNGNPFTVNSPSPLANGTYTIISLFNGTGTISTNNAAFPFVTGTAIGPGQYGFITIDGTGQNVQLNIQNTQPPFFVTEQGNVTASQGDNITLTNQVGGTGPLTFQWLINGVMIPGATNSSLSLTNAQPTNSGSFTLNVQSPFGVTNSNPAVVQVENPNLGLSDDFYIAPLFTINQMVGLSANQNATNETGAPNNDGKNGTHAVWMAWQPANSGVATYSTLGSAFDTVLAVYTNSSPANLNISNLVAVTADDDGGGFLTSSVQFNAVANQIYYIAVDGFGPINAGNIVLSWSLQISTAPLPVIVQQPLSFVAGIGNNVQFNVQAIGGTNVNGSPRPVTYQWLGDGLPIPNATNSSLALANVQPINAGNYAVNVFNGIKSVQSEPAFLQISAIAPNGSSQPVQAGYKLGSQLTLGSGQPGSGHERHSDGLGSAPVTGLSGTHYFSTTATPTSAAWFSIMATNDGPLLITTEGSGFANNFTLYSGPASAISTSELTKIKSAIANGYELTSRTNITAVSGTTYYVQVTGNGTGTGKATLNWAFNYSQAITRPPAGSFLGLAGTVLTDTLDPPDSAVWSTNQTTIPGPAGLTATQAPVKSAIYGVVNTIGGVATRDLVYQDVYSDTLAAAISGSNIIITYGSNTAPGTLYIESSTTPAGPWTVIKTLAPGAAGGTVTAANTGGGTYYRYSLTNP